MDKVKIFDISYEGAGVGKTGGKVVFVPKTLPGEEVLFEPVKTTSSFVTGRVLQVVKESENRIVPACPYFEICGGCDFLHTTYQNEQVLKTEILQRELAKVGFDGNIDFVCSNSRLGYRNKIKLEVQNGKLGYYKAKSHQFFEIKTCPIADEKILDALEKTQLFLQANAFKDLKNVYIKKVDSRVAICLLFDKNAKKVQKNLQNLQILSDFTLFFAYGEVLESDKTQIFKVEGQGELYKQFDGARLDFDMRAFAQVNDGVAEKLYEYVCQTCQGKSVINAYSGQGQLTYLLAKTAAKVAGIELQESAHERAQLLTQNLPNVQNFCSKVEDILPQVLVQKYDAIVLDPARAGCHKDVLSSICQSDLKQVLYISCNFATLVRDLKLLQPHFYIKTVKIFDMFACTANMETAVFLQRI